jgi:hypothetical protein
MNQLKVTLNEKLSPGESFEVVDQSSGHGEIILYKAEFRTNPHRADLFFDDAKEGDLLLLKARTLVRACTDRDEWDTTYSIWDVEDDKLAPKLHKPGHSWRLNRETGELLLRTHPKEANDDDINYEILMVAPGQWGYFQIIQKNWGWSNYTYNLNIAAAAGFELVEYNRGITTACRVLSRLIDTQEDRDNANVALHNVGSILASLSKADDDDPSALTTLVKGGGILEKGHAKTIANWLGLAWNEMAELADHLGVHLPENHLRQFERKG